MTIVLIPAVLSAVLIFTVPDKLMNLFVRWLLAMGSREAFLFYFYTFLLLWVWLAGVAFLMWAGIAYFKQRRNQAQGQRHTSEKGN